MLKTNVCGTKHKRRVSRRKYDDNSEASVEIDNCLSGVAVTMGKLLDNVRGEIEQEDSAKDLCVTGEKKVCLFISHRFDILFHVAQHLMLIMFDLISKHLMSPKTIVDNCIH